MYHKSLVSFKIPGQVSVKDMGNPCRASKASTYKEKKWYNRIQAIRKIRKETNILLT